jgi:hypothetical protein
MKRIRYISRFARALSASEIDELTRKAARDNKRRRITGMLVATGELFFQLIEGPDKAIDNLLARIRRDPRHRDLLVVGVESGALERICPDWAMARLDLGADARISLEPVKAILTAVRDGRRVIDELVASLEQLMWRELIEAESRQLAG